MLRRPRSNPYYSVKDFPSNIISDGLVSALKVDLKETKRNFGEDLIDIVAFTAGVCMAPYIAFELARKLYFLRDK